MFRSSSRFLLASCALGASFIVAMLTGCSGMQVQGSSSSGGTGIVTPHGTGANIGGGVKGGNQPITGATVRLYAAGTGSYGAPATLLATSISDSAGNYFFTNGVAGSPSGNSYVCPSGTSQIYITSNGGVTDGSGNSSNVNSAATLLAALGPCGSLSSSAPAYLNELTTVAAVSALAQYITPGTTPGTFSIGAPGTTQAQQGLANAVMQMRNLVNTGAAGPASQVISRTYPGATGALSTVAGVTITATPEATKLNTFADVIAACVNQTSASGSNCQKLFAAATPPPASQTSHPAVALPPATDTVMAAYYMAINPAQVSGTKGVVATAGAACGTNVSAMDCEFGLLSALSPFQNTLPTAPTDWTIGVTFSSASTCNAAGDLTLASTGYFFNGPVQQSVDASGNVWFVNGNRYMPGTLSGTASPATMAAMSPWGQPLACPLASSVGGRGISVDVLGNVWVAFNGTSSGVQEFAAPTKFTGDNGVGGITGLVVPTIPAVPTTPLQMTTDLAGNVFYVSAPAAGNATTVGGGELLYELPLGGVAWNQVSSFANVLSGVGFVPLQMTSDSKGRIWTADSSSNGPIYYYPNGATTGVTYTSGTLTSPGSTSPGLAAYGISVANVLAANVSGYTGSAVADVIFSGTTCCGSTTSTSTRYRAINRFNPTSYTANSAPAYAAGTSTGQSYAGLNGVRSLTVDGATNAWAGGEYPAGSDATATSTFAIYAVNASLQPISKTGTIPSASAQCSTNPGTDAAPLPAICATFGGFQKPDFYGGGHGIAVDNSGTVWVLNTGFNLASPGSNQAYNGLTITQVVGSAVPVTTPLSTAAANGMLGVAP